MISRENKIRIFAEYLFCIATNGIEEIEINRSNIEKLVDENFKIRLKSVYNLTQEEMFDIAEEMRYNRCLEESFRDFDVEHFHMSSESRNKTNLKTAMISYVAITDNGRKGNWFRLINAFEVHNLKAKSYDVGSCWEFVIKGHDIERLSLEEIGLAVIS
jgi:hypothetical protein